MVGTWVLGASLEVDPLFLLASRPFKPILYFRSMPSSSSSELFVTWVIINFRGRAAESLSDLVSESKSCTGLFRTLSSLSKWNLSISLSSDEREDAISSSVAVAWSGTYCNGTASSRGFCRIGSTTGGRSSRARKSGLDTSILASRGSPALMVCLTSWNIFEIGSNTRIRWTARSCLSSLTNISNLSRKFRAATLEKLSQGAT